jgi:hypothetical protein
MVIMNDDCEGSQDNCRDFEWAIVDSRQGVLPGLLIQQGG